MKQFCCGDVVPGCKSIFRSEDEQGLFTQIAVHARNDHGLMEIPSSLISQIRRSIQDVNAGI